MKTKTRCVSYILSSCQTQDNGLQETPPTPETILELAYIQNPKVFDRDAETRRSKARATLRARTGWVDEQIEGWRIMLERNVRATLYFARCNEI